MLTRATWSLAAWPWLVATGVALLLVGWAAGSVLAGGGAPGIDAATLDRVASWRSEAMIDAAHLLSLPGAPSVVAAVWMVLVTLTRRRSGRWDLAWLATLVVGGSLLIAGVVKVLTARARPDGVIDAAMNASFPSGHAIRAAAIWGLVAWLALRWGTGRPLRIGLAAIAVCLALVTGVSRVLLGVHWPTDVVFGWALSVVWLGACILVLRPRSGIPRAETVLDDLTDRLSAMLLDGRRDRDHDAERHLASADDDRRPDPTSDEHRREGEEDPGGDADREDPSDNAR